MQEVSVRPRSVFKHPVVVDQPGKELCWNFCTRRKNISFGLFRVLPRPGSSPELSKLVLASGTAQEVGRNYTLLPTQPGGMPGSASATGLAALAAAQSQDGMRRSIVVAAGGGAAGGYMLSGYNADGLNGMAAAGGGGGGGSAPGTPPSFVAKDGSSSSLQSLDYGYANSNTVGGSAGGGGGSKKQGQRPRLDDPELQEIIQIAHYESSKVTIKGSFFVQEPGTYVLVFDNRFSVNTAKKLFFFVALRDVEPSASIVKKEVEGWMLKKGNRAMQGFQRRWVEIDSNGTLTYFKSPGTPSRGTVNLPIAAIRLDHDHLLIDIDSGQNTYHFKVETAQEFERWISAIEKFAASKSMMQLQEEQGSFSENIMARASMISNSAASQSNMLLPVDPELENVQMQVEQMVSTLKKELGRMKEVIDTSKGRIDSKSQWKDFTLILGSISDVTAGLITNAATTENQLSSFHNRIRSQKERALFAIQQAESAFFACLNDNNRIRKKYGLETVSVANFLPSGGVFMTNDRDRMGSMTSTHREEVFFDAEEGESDDDDQESDSSDNAQDKEPEIVIEEDDSDPSASHPNLNGRVAALKFSSGDANGSLSSTSSSPRMPDSAASAASFATAFTDLPPNYTTSSVAVEETKKPMQVVRRTNLPAPTYSMENISVMSILRNNVGKDLSTVAMPIALNEPINLLQKLCEELEYSDLLDLASSITDPVHRLALIASFVVSGYSSTVYRAARKPFNPLLGETFEFIRDDKGFKYISEKVSHHPPIMACYAESSKFRFYQDSLLKTKFWGKSMELNNIGTVHLEFPEIGEHYVWNKVTTSMRNLFAPSRYLEHHGTMKIVSTKTGHYCELVFKESGYFTSANNEIVGSVFTPGGQKVSSLRFVCAFLHPFITLRLLTIPLPSRRALLYSGRWDHSFNKFMDSAPNNLEVLWRAMPFPPNQADNYGFTQFAVELNELTPDLEGMLPTRTRGSAPTSACMKRQVCPPGGCAVHLHPSDRCLPCNDDIAGTGDRGRG
ncbi:Oxysterol-binding protein-domain-containing protein [Entophlyctis helioformis]|nr:Oxysterol-binding protein-domain-containing protein [Entophlyctis helioformis]